MLNSIKFEKIILQILMFIMTSYSTIDAGFCMFAVYTRYEIIFLYRL